MASWGDEAVLPFTVIVVPSPGCRRDLDVHAVGAQLAHDHLAQADAEGLGVGVEADSVVVDGEHPRARAASPPSEPSATGRRRASRRRRGVAGVGVKDDGLGPGVVADVEEDAGQSVVQASAAARR